MDTKSFATLVISEGYRQRASDLYILPTYHTYQLYLRYHHARQLMATLSLEEGEQLILFFKFLGDMDVGEKRLPQAGACSMEIRHMTMRLRLSTVSNYRHQESLVIRFLYPLETEELYFLDDMMLNQTKHLIKQRGLHLFCGPVGSGKTTSMYMMAKALAHNQQIITIEDPVEIEEPSFLQLQVQTQINLDYDRLIKLCLRHRPDFIIIGEIRDEQTAHYAMRAAMTGHCVLATLHAKSFQGVRARLYDLHVSQTDMDQALKTITYQRIVPLYCPFCRGECSPFCSRYRQHYPVLLVSECQHEGREKWNELLQRSWSCGYITKETCQEYEID